MSNGTSWESNETYESMGDAIDFGWHYARARQKMPEFNSTLISVEAIPMKVKGL